MKPLLTLVFCLMTILASAQAYHGTKSYPIYRQGAQRVSNYDDEGKEIVRIEYDLIFSKKVTYRDLSSDWEYTIVGFADDGVKDLDLKLFEWDDLLEQWTEVASDALEDNYPVMTYKPSVSAQYKIEVIVYSFHEGYSAARYGLIIYHD